MATNLGSSDGDLLSIQLLGIHPNSNVFEVSPAFICFQVAFDGYNKMHDTCPYYQLGKRPNLPHWLELGSSKV